MSLYQLGINAITGAKKIKEWQLIYNQCVYDISDFKLEAQRLGYSFDLSYGDNGTRYFASFGSELLGGFSEESECYTKVLLHMSGRGLITKD